ncbi:PREDICTED: endo-1,3;1,4-beta-D-glucanase-like [Tarenaya hassleriana]|uniref:endo-1,3;1,4-beta-D-glucanase-like n=1 Tax=Tarenaya hassleriana TaxID=28532 RepID=UPI00053C9B05|nr:PREDICTED: endo-1,3;1,4-beta-D-glucanase-like [Tarenaya hassleriana]
MSGPQCCENPPTLNPKSGSGHVEKLGGLDAYIVGSPDSSRAILLVSDVFGYEAPNLRKLADKVAESGFYVAVPDYFYGDPCDNKNQDRPLAVWIKDHGADKGFEDSKPVVKALKSKGITSIGAAGMCWGSKVVVELAKSLPNKMYLKQRLIDFKMDATKSIEDNVDVFKKLVNDLSNLKIEVAKEDQVLILLNSLPDQYDQLKDTLRYNRRETITLDEITSVAYSKELELAAKGTRATAEGLVVRGRSEKRNSTGNKSRKKSRSKSRSKSETECWFCGKEGHFKRDCRSRKKHFEEQAKEIGEAAAVTQSILETEHLRFGT